MRPRVYGPLLVVGALILTALWVANCSGPRPVITSVHLQPPQTKNGPYQVDALVRNDGPGQGQVDVTVRLRNAKTAQTLQADTRVSLNSGETTHVILQIAAPPATYTPEADVSYPIR